MLEAIVIFLVLMLVIIVCNLLRRPKTGRRHQTRPTVMDIYYALKHEND